MASIKSKIEELRRQPEHVRLRAATILTAISGGVVVLLWVTVLLPLQLHFANPAPKNEAPQTAVRPTLEPSAGVVSGVRVYSNDASGAVSNSDNTDSLLFAEPSPSEVPLNLAPVQVNGTDNSSDSAPLPLGQ